MSDRSAISVEDDKEDNAIDEIQSIKALREFDKGPLKDIAQRWKRIEELAEHLGVRVFPNDVGDFIHIFDDSNNFSTHVATIDEAMGFLLGLNMIEEGHILKGQDQIKGFFSALQSRGIDPHEEPEPPSKELWDNLDNEDVPF